MSLGLSVASAGVLITAFLLATIGLVVASYAQPIETRGKGAEDSNCAFLSLSTSNTFAMVL
jgi:hypothetical protein